MFSKIEKFVIAYCLFVTFNVMAESSPTFEVSEEPPPGFEDLAEEPTFEVSEEPPPGFEDFAAEQTTQVDVYFGGKALGAAFATFSANSFAFDKPTRVAKAIPNIKEISVVADALTGQLNPHTDLLCLEPGNPPKCGILEPDKAGIIFDADKFRVDVFVHPTLLSLSTLNIDRYLPLPETGFSTITTLNGTFSGMSSREDHYNFDLETLAAYRLGRFHALGRWSDTGGAEIETLLSEIDWHDHEAAFGMFNIKSMSLLGLPDVFGVRFSSSFNSRLDLAQAYGNQITVFLPRRSSVQIYRNNRVLSVQMYEAGNHVLDTSDLPDGSYNIELRIRDLISGEEQQETHFFAKSTNLPPLGESFYFAESGLVRANSQKQILPTYTSTPLLRLGFSQRLTTNFGYAADLLAIDKQSVIGLTLFTMGRDKHLRLGGIMADNGAYGIDAQGFIKFGEFSNTLSLRRLWDVPLSKVSKADDDNLTTILPPAFTQINFFSGYQYNIASFRLRASWRQRETDKKAFYTISPSLRLMPIIRFRHFYANLELEYTRSRNDSLLMAHIRFYQNIPHLGMVTHAAIKHQPENIEQKNIVLGDVTLNWNDQDLWAADVRASTRLIQSENQKSARITSDYRGGFGKFSGFAEQTQQRKGEKKGATLYGSNFTLGFVNDNDGMVFTGKRGRSGVIIDIRGTPKGARFYVFINGQRRDIALIGTPRLLPLEPYRIYKIRLKPHTETYADYDTSTRLVTLYPGNTQRLVWKVEQVFILIATIIRPDGTVVENAEIEGAIGDAETELEGLFQAEVRSNSKLMVRPENGNACQVQVPADLNTDSGIVTIDKLICK
jgi:outer membrane usher protein FimD/PapC